MKWVTPKILKSVFKMADDILLLIGIALITYGVFLIYPPAGFMVLGFSFLGMAFLVAKRLGK